MRAGAVPRADVIDFFRNVPEGLRVYEAVAELLGNVEHEVRVSASQVAFRRKRGFAYLWIPGRYLSNAQAPVVLSIALGRRDPSPRFKEVVHPTARHWMHHFEIRDPSDLDDEVAGWLREAAARAG